MTNSQTPFRDRLLAAEPISPDSREKIQQELRKMFVRELSLFHRIVIVFVAVFSVVMAGVCAFLAVTEPTLPIVARIGLGTGTLFGLLWMVVAVSVLRRGSMNLKTDATRMAAMAWVFTVLMMVFFLMVGMSAKDRMLGLMMIANGLAFLIGAGVVWITNRIEQSQLDTRERLLQIELRIAELGEGVAMRAKDSAG